jgi:hypothetical protein
VAGTSKDGSRLDECVILILPKWSQRVALDILANAMDHGYNYTGAAFALIAEQGSFSNLTLTGNAGIINLLLAVDYS